MLEVEEILRQMTLEEKAALCTGASAWTTLAIPRLGVPEMVVSDGPHGLRRVADVHAVGTKSLPATAFPTASCLSATWNRELLREVGAAIAREAIALGVDVVLGPGNNMKRSPLCGRNFEYFSEDPYLAGELAASYIQGVQSQGVGTSLKHYAANNQEYQRLRIDVRVDERTLREIYLTGFEIAVKKGRPWTVMCAYNKVNGTYASEHRYLLQQVLKDEWGFEGLVVSDWGAVVDRVAALEAGLDLAMPGPKARFTQALVEAVRSGRLEEARLDEAVRRILRVVFRAKATPKGGQFDAEAHHALARRAAAEGMVLLKNEGLLPLKNPLRIAVIGRSALHPQFQGGGSSNVNPTRVDIPLEELRRVAGEAQVTYAEGYPEGLAEDPRLIEEAVAQARAAEVALVFVALPPAVESEGYDRPFLGLTPQQEALIQAVSQAQPRTVVVLNTGSAVDMRSWIGGVGAVLQGWLMGQAGAGAIADILFGRINPSGKLAETFPMRLQDTPAYLNFPGENGEVRYGEGIYIGYRYYEAKELPVLFPFGHGLSYTAFRYANLRCPSRFKDTEGLRVAFEVTNTGQVAGKEVVQVYVRDPQSSLPRPPKELKGFAKVALEPGETKTVEVELDYRAFAYYHPGLKDWVAEEGEYEILVGASSADIRLRQTVVLEATRDWPSLLNEESTLREWLQDKRGRKVMEPFLEEMLPQIRAAFGLEEGETFIGMDLMGFLLDMPLRSLLDFQSERLPTSPEVMVRDLLRRVRDGVLVDGEASGEGRRAL
ncbi:MAG: glycoside hydrolase family 3 C-terminal domain-containing protein [Meiothermus sp.]|uniref:glycoside hydrolase family 3 C-terminal domain-containing protein n=1 Tax=Meiothermus sp. TaxID=1955249 RepID=UPI00263A0808|nr:glycoside hydrolase family 3 C-terminal domain-containing protein [Meiothermus sp.]MCS7058755.1 glycoside hydrolase family 3 C-terminal domain-containing protein [Meiothermus sp.]